MYDFLNHIAAHPTYSNNTKECYSALAGSALFGTFLALLKKAPNEAEGLIADKKFGTRQYYFKLAKLYYKFIKQPFPEVEAVDLRVNHDNPLPIFKSRPMESSWGDLMSFIRRVEEIDWKLILEVAALTGCRAGELFALTPSSYDPRNRTLFIGLSYCFRTATFSVPKNGEGRIIPVNKQLADLLEPRMGEEFLLPHPAMFKIGHQSTVLKQLCHKYGFVAVKFHEIRALFATKLLAEGVPEIKVMAICGWSNSLTADRYKRASAAEIHGSTDCLNQGGNYALSSTGFDRLDRYASRVPSQRASQGRSAYKNDRVG